MDAEKLKKRTKDFSLEIIGLYKVLPKTAVGEILGKQPLRSTTSVAANYRAACRARSAGEFSSKLQIVIEESDECLFWLKLLGESGLLPKERLQNLMHEADNLTAIFVASPKTVNANRQHREKP
ncbi:MAG: four helix bundle protein [Anaerolineales bacterium]